MKCLNHQHHTHLRSYMKKHIIFNTTGIKLIPLDVLEFHTLVSKQTNAPVDLQMGTILPFVASCMGPKTRGHFLTTPSCLNLFWIVVAASGAGKSQSRKRFISEPLEYILSNGRVKIEDFEISKFTRAGESIII